MASNTWKVEIIIEDKIITNHYDAESLAEDIKIGILSNTAGLKILELKAGLIASKVDNGSDQG